MVQPDKITAAFPENADINYDEILTNNIEKQRKLMIPEDQINEELFQTPPTQRYLTKTKTSNIGNLLIERNLRRGT